MRGTGTLGGTGYAALKLPRNSVGSVQIKKSAVTSAKVKDGSLLRDGTHVAFVVSDTDKEVRVTYQGMLPDLFKEGRGVVAQGRINASGEFEASEVLAKHDENYMPPEAQHAMDQAAAAKAAQSVQTPTTGKGNP